MGFYRQKPAGEVAFSEDGSVLAIVFKDVITLWDPDFNTMHQDVISLASSDVNIRYNRVILSFMVLYAVLAKSSLFIHHVLDSI